MANNTLNLENKIDLFGEDIYKNIKIVGEKRMNKINNAYYRFKYGDDEKLSIMPGACGDSFIARELYSITLVRNKFFKNNVEYTNVAVIGFLSERDEKNCRIHEKELKDIEEKKIIPYLKYGNYEVTHDNIRLLLHHYFEKRLDLKDTDIDAQIQLIVENFRSNHSNIKMLEIEKICQNDYIFLEEVLLNIEKRAFKQSNNVVIISAIIAFDAILRANLDKWSLVLSSVSHADWISRPLNAAKLHSKNPHYDYFEEVDWREIAEEEERNMDEETDGFWRIQNDYD